MQQESISLNKYISSTGICSRREADSMIEKGRISINGKKAKKGNRVEPGDKVTIDGKPLRRNLKKRIYIAYNKPIGIVSTTDSKERKNIIKAINHKERIFPIGRLDKDSQGLILLTNDGDIVNKILRESNAHDKEYIVRVDKPINKAFVKNMENGLPVLGELTKKCKVSIINKNTFNIILTQGLNRQIRRMCEYLGYEVKSLKRIRIMNIKLGNLRIGQYRNLNSKELKDLLHALKDSKKNN